MNNQQSLFIRNFSIIAHIDHGKSTLADRLIEYCGGLTLREMTHQVLDSMDIEKERGITIKAQAVRLMYKAQDGNLYCLNLIDTPGHVDFSYEVSRSLASCEGSLLVIDSSQGVEAQTLANVYQAIDNNHKIIPVLNKIDLVSSNPDQVIEEIKNIIGLDVEDTILISAKNGTGIVKVLETIVNKLPCPKVSNGSVLKALLLDSWYDLYLGVVILVRVVDGALRKNMKIKMMSTGLSYNVENVGYFTPKKHISDILYSGEIGFFTASIKQVDSCKVGDTITELNKFCDKPLAGFKNYTPVVFCSLYPVDITQLEYLQDSLSKLKLNDSSFTFERDNSKALGFGFRCGFLGLLHLEIIKERLKREYNITMIVTPPSVLYKVNMSNGEELMIYNAYDLPESYNISSILEPWIKATIFTPNRFLGNVLTLCTNKRGIQVDLNYINDNRVIVVYKLPLNEVVFDFYDQLKNCTQGYSSFTWILDEYKKSNLVKLSILINSELVNALCFIIHYSRSLYRAKELCKCLKDLIPRQLFDVSIQAIIGKKIIARETIKALRKDVTAKCYGGDITRKRKLLEKQKAGKKKMRAIGNLEIPYSTLIAALKTGYK